MLKRQVHLARVFPSTRVPRAYEDVRDILHEARLPVHVLAQLVGDDGQRHFLNHIGQGAVWKKGIQVT